ncbi:hypothetical protein [Leptothermofonsia sp. ETS-13]|uniref:hypothetical protein n=1 Tax=Leptothermofonsia sp. ETS-13 TaxID=3035696 RepID=UPI003B9FA5EA
MLKTSFRFILLFSNALYYDYVTGYRLLHGALISVSGGLWFLMNHFLELNEVLAGVGVKDFNFQAIARRNGAAKPHGQLNAQIFQ